ncbi:MAG: calcineurin, partial [Spirochaetales bacterium]
MIITLQDVKSELRRLLELDAPPDPEEVADRATAAVEVMRGMSPRVRPRNERDEIGGIVHLRPELPTVVVPDIHARP